MKRIILIILVPFAVGSQSGVVYSPISTESHSAVKIREATILNAQNNEKKTCCAGEINSSAVQPVCEFYPNPSTGLVHMYCDPSILTYTLVDVRGNKIYEAYKNHEQLLRLKEVPPGHYLVFVEDIDKRTTRREMRIDY